MKPEPWMMPYLTGKCFDFALALDLPEAELVCVGDLSMPEHVGLKVGEAFVDVRGILTETEFVAHHAGFPLVAIGRDQVEFHCGLSGYAPPYEGNEDIGEALDAVDRVFPKGVVEALESHGVVVSRTSGVSMAHGTQATKF